MFKFEKEQKIVEIGEVKLGGQPGELPTVLMGSMFYHGHKIVKDSKRGIFDKEEARRLIRTQEEMSEKTGNPCMVVLELAPESSAEAVKNYIDFVSETTDAPFLMGGYRNARITGVRYAAEVGLIDRLIFDSITYETTEDEIEAINDSKVKSAIIQSFNPKDPRPIGALRILEEGESRSPKIKEGLLKLASDIGIENKLILTSALDVAGLGCITASSIYTLKSKLGLPCGAPPVGIVGRWFNKLKEFEEYAKGACRACAVTLCQVMGADYIMYGSIEKAEHIFPACGMIDGIIAFHMMKTYKIKPLTKNHPAYKMRLTYT